MNALLGGGKQGSGGHGGSNPLGNLAGQFLGGGSHGGGSGGGKQSSGLGGKLVGQLASNLFSPSNKPAAPQNYHGGQTSGGGHSQPHNQGGIAGAVFGGVAELFGGGKPGQGHGGQGNNVCASSKPLPFSPRNRGKHGVANICDIY